MTVFFIPFVSFCPVSKLFFSKKARLGEREREREKEPGRDAHTVEANQVSVGIEVKETKISALFLPLNTSHCLLFVFGLLKCHRIVGQSRS